MARGKYKVLHGDCVQLIPRVVEKYGRPQFIFSDPPFNVGQDYSGYVDVMEEAAFDLWTREWIKVCWEALAPGGVLALHGPDRLAELYLMAAHFFDMNRIAWVNWHFRFGQCGHTNWINAREHCLIFAKGEKWTWNPEAVLVDSDRATVYGDERTKANKKWPGKRVPFSVWGLPSDGPNWGRIQGNNEERQPEAPNQIPEKVMGRLLLAYTNSGDLVLDPFGGSGTTATVAAGLGRNVVTIDVSAVNVELIRKRVKRGPVRTFP